MKEIFKDIPNYKGLYEISNLGRVLSIRNNRILNQWINSGYYRTKLSNNGIYKDFNIHQLVAIAFLNHKPDGHKIVVDHKDYDKLNNRLNNLQLISNRENCSKDKKGGYSTYVGVTFEKGTKKWKSSIYVNGKNMFLGYFDDENEANKYYKNALFNHNNNLEIKTRDYGYSSEYRGVHYDKNWRKWRAIIVINGIRKELGTFINEIDAANAYIEYKKLNNI